MAFTYLKVKSGKCLSLLPVVLVLVLFFSGFGLGVGLGLVILVSVLVLRIWSCLHHWIVLENSSTLPPYASCP